MNFCPKCGSILRPKEKSGKRILWCACGFTINPEDEQKEQPIEEVETRVKSEVRTIEIVKEINTNPIVKATCEKCENKEAYYWTQQTRGADEPETRFFRCTKCKHTWREYS